MASQIKLRRGTAAQWTESNPVLAEGEAGFETDTNQLKIGNGTDNWATLDYISADLTPYLTISSASSTYAPLNDPTFTDDVIISGDLRVNGQIDLLMSGSTSLVNISSFDGMGSELYISSNDNFIVQGFNGTGTVSAKGTMLVNSDNGNVLITGGNGEFINSTASANQIATVGNLETKADKVLSVVAEKTSAYTIANGDQNKIIQLNGGSAGFTLSIPTDATYNFDIGTQITLLSTNTGTITIAAVTPGTTTVNATPGLKLRTQWSSATLIKRAANSWVVIGDLIA